MSNNAKDLRKQLKNLIQIELPELLEKEISTAAYKQISTEIQTRLNIIEKNVQEALARIEQANKDSQNFIQRQVLLATQPQISVPQQEFVKGT